ncbi:PLP-dependent aminotransferase family protein [Nocardia cyriacigeorgica]|uniref:PLP-dependent aminotransferase family protein n=1 Tax=Nocardia cyriacigeorgica TaxID=135487 RepID=A0A6P1CY83_9NOCA|nr:PLP-dependent aminotransferase family protein [Nocardia cyriacigeorgica]MBF6427097.1 PLP-dependent aminotransferase family protein [Nocardia cyriacigeorgica]NEW36633.1 PLP-dependent aminotransferase family protein [Nocardia cyriacigeorgica]
MANLGDTSGLELLITVEPGRPVRAQVESALRAAIRNRRLPAGQRLPASRVLAADLGVSRRLVAEVYEQLCAEGYLTVRRGAGTWVSDTAVPGWEATDRAAHPDEGLESTGRPTGVDRGDRQSARSAPPAAREGTVWVDPYPSRASRWDLRPGLPTLSGFPRRAWRTAWLAALTNAADADLGYPPAAGHPRLRAVIAAYLNRVRGIAAAPGTTLISAGFTQGLDLVCRTLHAAGARTIALEDPGLPHRAAVIRHAGLTALPIPVDEDGIVVDALPAGGVDAVLITPAHQFPTGAALAPYRREAVLTWAARTGAYVIEDDYDGEFRFDRRAIAALQGLAPDRVIYLGTTSKTLAPALRLGWLVAPAQLMEALIDAKFHTDHGSPVLDQLALAEMIGNGGYDRHIRQCRARYSTHRRALAAALDRHRVPIRLTGVAAGVQTLALLDTGNPDDLVRRAAAAGIGFDAITRYQHTPDPAARALVLGYGNITPNGIDQAVAALARLV